ncbi:glycoside hydrolase family 2 TIM barrel-domain containing protein [Arthrobacter sp. NPDC056691]|uniref:glycoside hydrolase family 2 TIM barrel-domain containing protein n=1 Tax=Arthrobacter sp. NPDC056691 TaxID=3345913 RepID=UPI00366DCBE1
MVLLDSAPATAASAGNRSQTSFDADWRFLRDDPAGAESIGFNDSYWRVLDVPHDWQIEDLPYATSENGEATASPQTYMVPNDPSLIQGVPPVIGPFDANADLPGGYGPAALGGRGQGYTVGGVGWYRKHFTVPKDALNRRVEVRFDGVFQTADFWLNGFRLGFNAHGYLPAIFDLTDHLDFAGQNVLAVRVQSPNESSRWYSGSGIYRHTWLTATSDVCIPTFGVQVTTPVVAGNSLIHTAVEVRNDGSQTANAQVRTTLLDPGHNVVGTQTSGSVSIVAGDQTTYSFGQWISGARLWDPEQPNLYTARTEVLMGGRVIDSNTTTFGIRSMVWNGTDGFLLNGKRIKLNGGNVHHDHGPLGAISLDRSEERKIEILKAAGFNAVRPAHTPFSPHFLDTCDKLGMLVWNEPFDIWDLPAKAANDYHLYFPTHWQSDLTTFIRRDRNHPSVIIWSIGNEIAADPNAYGPRLADHVRSLDVTRPVSLGGADLLKIGPDPWTYLDVFDFHGNPGATDHAAHPDKAITQSEVPFNSNYDNAKLAQASPWYVGSLVWAGWDYIGEGGIGATTATTGPLAAGGLVGTVGYPYFQGFCGDIDLIGQRKPQNLYREVFVGHSPLEMVVLRPTPPGTQQVAVNYAWYDALESWTWDQAQLLPLNVQVYTSGDTVQLLLNGLLIASNTVQDSDKQMTNFRVPYAPGQLTAIASRNGLEIARKTLTTTGAPAGLRLTSDVQNLTTGRDDLAHVLVEVIDKEGRRVPDAVTKISFYVSGAGNLIGVGNGNPRNVDSFKRPRRHTWHGQALAVLRPSKSTGTLTMTATAPGLNYATMSLPVR